jgi:hypothetical protein
MRACIVSSSTIAKYRRWDAGFYCGMVEGKEIDEAIIGAEKRLRSAARSLVNLWQKKKEHEVRIRRMIAAGEVRPL